MTREYIGTCGVDSGSILIIDPCYLNDAKRWNPAKLVKLAEEYKKKGEDTSSVNCRRLATEKNQLQNILFDWKAYCNESNHEPREYAGGVISPTRHGDGGFPVYVHRDKEGRVKKMEIVF